MYVVIVKVRDLGDEYQEAYGPLDFDDAIKMLKDSEGAEMHPLRSI